MKKSTLDKKGLIHWIDNRLPIFTTLKAFLVDYKTPKNLNFAWNFGSLLGVTLVIMIFSGIFLAMHYVADPDVAFKSVERIMRDVPYGWLIRYIHMNGASMFFILTYLHMFRGLYYGSYRNPRELLWIFGVIIFLVMMATAFMGYVLPWGQMSYWGATVITNLFTAIPFVGDQILEWLLGGFSVGAPTLNRFFALHYLLPFGLIALVLLHLLSLHQFGSNNPLGISVKSEKDTIPFHPYYTYKDLFGLGLFFLFFSVFIFFFPNFFGEPDNYIPANPLVTPPHIVPEWYFLPFYAILRSIPNKLGGVIAMFGSIFVLFLLPWLDRGKVTSAKFRPYFRLAFWLFVVNSFILGWVGSKPAENPYIVIGQLSTFFYFGFFFMIIPLLSYFERPCVLPNSIHEYITNKGRKG